MAFRLYIVPSIGAGTADNMYRPKYFDGKRWAGMNYGFQPQFLVAADLLAADDSAIIANADVFAFPFDLNPNLTAGQANLARDAMELALIPAQWVSAQMTWRGVARIDAGMFQFMQRLQSILGNEVVIDSTAKLNAQWGTIPANVQQAILQTADSFGYSTAFIQTNTQVRTILKTFSDQWGSKSFQLNEFIF